MLVPWARAIRLLIAADLRGLEGCLRLDEGDLVIDARVVTMLESFLPTDCEPSGVNAL